MERLFTKIASDVALQAGKPLTFISCVMLVAIWGLTGPMFAFSDSWQLVINTGTTIVTFLMVFLIQNTQNRDGAAIQAKLDELIRVSKAKNEFIGIEHLTAAEVEEFRHKCEAAAARALKDHADRRRHTAPAKRVAEVDNRLHRSGARDAAHRRA